MIAPRHIPVLITAALFAALFLLGSLQYDGFASLSVFLNLFTDNAFLAVTAIGMTFVILSGGIDLSVGAVIAFTGVLTAVLIQQGWPIYVVFPLVVAIGSAFGAAMGALIHYYRLQPFIVTLAGMFLMRGLAVVVSERSVPIENGVYDAINAAGVMLPGRGFIGAQALILAVVLAGAVILAHYRRFGTYVYAIGGNAESAKLMAVPVAQTTIGIYALSSFLAALAGIMFSFYTSSGYALAGLGLELDAIAAVVIGGTLLTGGSGYVLGTLVGVMLMGLVQTYIAFNGSLNSWWTKIVIGVLVLVFVCLQRLQGARKSKPAG
ncbi:MAG: galactofuranose ABC transporter, permease protein YjfF [Henriciella sp.]|uniref:galactofuranose ABC transporter, permease protein YjfF n=1 Tax=Henriciella sp. TaxID=1968823 RepID=UPI003C71EF9F